MKSLIIFAILLLYFFPPELKAQWKRETGFLTGVILADYDKSRFSNGEPGVLMKFGLAQSWLQPDKMGSFRPEISLNTEIFPIK